MLTMNYNTIVNLVFVILSLFVFISSFPFYSLQLNWIRLQSVPVSERSHHHIPSTTTTPNPPTFIWLIHGTLLEIITNTMRYSTDFCGLSFILMTYTISMV